MSDGTKSIIKTFSLLEAHEKIDFLSWIYKNEPAKYDYASMCEGLRKFHDPKAKRDHAP